MHTLKTTLLGSSVFVSEADISQYSDYCIHSGMSKRSSKEKGVSNSLSLNKASTPLVEPTHSRAVWKISLFAVLDGDFPLLLKHLDLAVKTRLLLLHRKGLQTPANAHQFNSVR